jgi:hypothetical protein
MKSFFTPILLLVPLLLQAERLKIRFEDVSLDNGSVVSFSFDDVDASGPDLKTQNSIESASADNVNVYCDMSSTSFNGITYYTFDTYVRVEGKPGWQHLKAKAHPAGPFLDTRKAVSFIVVANSRTIKGQITLPLYNPFYAAPTGTIYALGPDETLQSVHVGSAARIELHAKNPYEQLPIMLLSVEALPAHKEYWNRIDASVSRPLLSANSNSEAITVVLTPNLVPALMASVSSHSRADGDESVLVKGTYQSLPGGPIRETESLKIRVSFVPSGLQLLIALILGVAIAVLGLSLLQQMRLLLALKGAVASLVAAILMEIIGLGFVQAHSSFTLFGFSLDPVTAQGSFLVGALAALLCVRRSSNLLAWLDKKITFDTQTTSSLLLFLIMFASVSLRGENVPYQPVGIAANDNGTDLVALSKEGDMFSISKSGNELHTDLLCKIPVRGVVLDINHFSLNGKDMFVAIQFNQVTGLTEYDVCGSNGAQSLMRQHGLVVAAAADPSSSAVWIANSQTKEISRITSGKSQFVLDIPTASTITSLGFDPAKHSLYAGDPVRGAIFYVDTISKKVRQLSAGMGDIRAISVDSPRHRLLIVDASRRKIWSIPEPGVQGKPVEVRTFPHGSQPCGLAIARDQIWVADCAQKNIYSTPLGSESASSRLQSH